MTGSCEHDIEISGSVIGGEFPTSYATVSFSSKTLPHGVRTNYKVL